MSDTYRFTIDAGQVIAVHEYDDGAWELKSPESGESYALDSLDGTVVLRFRIDDGVTRTQRFVSVDGGNTYHESNDELLVQGSDDHGDSGNGDSGNDDGPDHEDSSDDLYQFSFGPEPQVIAVAKLEDGIWKPERIDANESYRLDPILGKSRITRTEIERGGVKTKVYEDPEADGTYRELESGQNPVVQAARVFLGSAGRDSTRGGEGDDEVYGDEGDDDLSGGEGADDLFGDGGDDDIAGGDNDDEIYGGQGNDDLSGDLGDDDISGDEGNDSINGGEGADDLDGGTGRDKLTGGLGQDHMRGGFGADVFTYTSSRDSEVGELRDVIADFSASDKDKLGLAGIDANPLARRDQAFKFISTRPFTRKAGQLRYEALESGVVVIQGDTTGDGVSDFEIALHGVDFLVKSNFVL